MKNFFLTVWQSISDFDFYKKAVTFKFSAVIKYLLILLLIFSFLLSIGVSLRLKPFFNSVGSWAVENLPDINITDGKASVDAPMPFKIEKENFAVILDTTGQTTSLDESVEQGILLTEDKVILKQSEFQTNTYELSKIKNLVINKNMVEKWNKGFLRVMIPFLFLSSLVYYTIAKILQILFFSIIPLIINNIKNINLKYSEILKISTFALTLPFIVATVVEIVFFKVPFFPFLFIAIYAVFLVKGTLSCVVKPEAEGTV